MRSEIPAPVRAFLAAFLLIAAACDRGAPPVNPAELEILRSLSIAVPEPLPASVSNRVGDDPAAARLGHALFFDPGLSRGGAVACATCHEPTRYFTDGLPQSQGLGRMTRNAPTLVGAAYAPWQFWDGRRDSLWAQALAPLEAPREMGGTRLGVVRYVTRTSRHAEAYAALFGEPPMVSDLPAEASPFGSAKERSAWASVSPARQHAVDTAFANIGKALGAYQRQLLPKAGPFDRAIAALARGDLSEARHLDPEVWEGARLFADNARTQCLRCHNGPLLTNQSFHRIATSQGEGARDLGRFIGIQAVLLDPFNCAGPFSDAAPEQCRELRFVSRRHIEELQGAFKTPTLRGLAKSGPYMHDGRFDTLVEVMEHYRNPPPPQREPHELIPLEMSDEEVAAMVVFLLALGDEVAAEPHWLVAPSD